MAKSMARIDYKELIPEVRSRIKKIYESDPDQYDQVDIKRVLRSDWSILRFIKFNRGDINKAVQQLDAVLQERHNFGINTRTINDFPQEFYRVGAIFTSGVDRFNRPVIYFRLRAYKKLPAFTQAFRQLIGAYADKVDRDAKERGYILIMDLSSAGLANVDMEFVRYVLTTLRDYYPCGLRCIYVYNLPWVIRPFFTITQVLASALKLNLELVNDHGLKQLIPDEHLPSYLGGMAQFDFAAPPENSPTVREWAKKYGISERNVDKYYETYQPIILETYKVIMNYHD